jgi:hypothetical protein
MPWGWVLRDDSALALADAAADADCRAAGDLFDGLLAIERHAVAAHHFNLLRWLIELPVAADPAAAAALVLGHQRRHPQPTLSTPLLDLLRDVSRSPLGRLGRRARNRHNRRHLTRRH